LAQAPFRFPNGRPSAHCTARHPSPVAACGHTFLSAEGMAGRAAILLAAAGWGLQASGAPQEACEAESCASDAAGLLQVHQTAGGAEVRADAAAAHGASGGWWNRPKLPEPLVHAVYTYGAPATRGEPFRNAAASDGCFPGLRSYTEDIKGAFDEIKQVDAAAMHNYYHHARTASVVLRWDRDSIYTPCNAHLDGHPEWPQRGASVYHEWRLHQEDDYVDRLKNVAIEGTKASELEPFKTAKLFAELAWRGYDNFENEKKWIANNLPGWRLVLRALDSHGNDEDPVMIVQESSTLDCAIVFAGTNDFSEFSTSTTQYGTGYCGFDDVHVGYRNELWTITNHMKQHLKPTLEKCRMVTCVGHSLGGALCEIFAACANSGNSTDPDYQLLAWNKTTPVLQADAGWTMKAHED